MSAIVKNIYDLIGNTPILRMERFMKKYELSAELLAKIESFNPAGSIKDRVALNMIEAAENCGKLYPGAVIIEPTSGNTGIGLASIAAAKGYRIILTMPETMSAERRMLLKAFGAELVLTDGAQGMSGAIQKAEELGMQIEGSFIPAQFENPENPGAHVKTTGPELWEQTGGKLDVLVATVGTGGTITGLGTFLKGKNPRLKIIAVEPKDSAVLSGNRAGVHKIQGIGAGFVPKVLNTKIYDEVIAVENEDAFAIGRDCAKTEGLLVGISSGAALWAAIQVAKRPENREKTVAVILPDTGERYLSGEMFAKQ